MRVRALVAVGEQWGKALTGRTVGSKGRCWFCSVAPTLLLPNGSSDSPLHNQLKSAPPCLSLTCTLCRACSFQTTIRVWTYRTGQLLHSFDLKDVPGAGGRGVMESRRVPNPGKALERRGLFWVSNGLGRL